MSSGNRNRKLSALPRWPVDPRGLVSYCERFALAILLGTLAVGAGQRAVAQGADPARVALVVGNSSYSSLPALNGCAAAVPVVSAALRNMGFDVLERQNAGRGSFDALVTTFARKVLSNPGATVVAYVCGYAVDFGGRTFLLPTSAAINNDFDVLTQGMIARSVQDAAERGSPRISLVLFDAMAKPEGLAAPAFSGASDHALSSGQALVAAVNTRQADGPTALAVALERAFVPPGPALESLLRTVQLQLSDAGVQLAAIAAGPPGASLAPPPPPPAARPPEPSPPPMADVAPAPTTAAALVEAQPQPAAAPPPMAVVLPDEERMTDADRRRVQAALATLGYYSGRIDARFGPETRAGIRRYQFEIGTEMTGMITGEQASRLVSGIR